MTKLINIFPIIVLLLLYYNISYSQTVTWIRYFDFFPSSPAEECHDILQTYDGGYAMLVEMGSIELIKVNPKGHLEWYRILDSSYSIYGLLGANSFQQTSDSGFIIAGLDDSSRAFLFKMDKTGNLIWRKYFRTPGYHSAFLSVKITNDNGFIACGDIYNDFDSKYYIVKTDSLGNVQWSKLWSDQTDNYFADIILSTDGNYYLVGASSSSTATGVLKKLNSNGDIIWTKNFYSGGIKLVQNKYGFIYTGGGQGTIYVNKFDTSGHQLWQKSYYTGGYYFGMCLTRNDNLVFAGALTDSVGIDVIATKFDSSGALVLNKTINPHGNYFDAAFSIKITDDNGFIVGGKTTFGGSSSNYNVLAIKTDSQFNAPSLVGIQNNTKEIKTYNLHQNYPNPFNPSTKISYSLPNAQYVSLKVYDVLGNELAALVNKKQNAGNYEIEFGGSNFASGVYFYNLEIEGRIVGTKRMLLLK